MSVKKDEGESFLVFGDVRLLRMSIHLLYT